MSPEKEQIKKGESSPDSNLEGSTGLEQNGLNEVSDPTELIVDDTNLSSELVTDSVSIQEQEALEKKILARKRVDINESLKKHLTNRDNADKANAVTTFINGNETLKSNQYSRATRFFSGSDEGLKNKN